MMGVPESLERLLTDTMMGRGIHQHHAEHHYMACDSACFGEVYLDRCLRADLVFFDMEEAVSLETDFPFRLGMLT